MTSTSLRLIDATPAHFDAIVRIERACGGGSVVALTEGLALQEALERGHDLVVATGDGDVLGWAWFASELARGGEQVGTIFRVAVADDARRSGIGGALVAHARAMLTDRGCARLRATLAADDEAGRALLASAGFAVDAITMERAL
jgi:ribosomal protein S18 acetylase RimI-like enzyme